MLSSWKPLEMDKILSLLALSIKTATGKAELASITPLEDADKINAELSIVHEMTEFMRFDGSLRFEETCDIESFVETSKTSGFILDALELLEIAKVILIFYENAEKLTQDLDKYPQITCLFQSVTPPVNVAKRIAKIIDDEGHISDNASEELKRIRKRKSGIRDDIFHKLNGMMNSEGVSEYVQEKIVTVRDGRFVIPFKTQSKNKIESIIHSFSKSGETAYIEPKAVIQLNNEIIEIEGLELAEIRKILGELTQTIAENADDIVLTNRLLGRMEMLVAKARFALKYRCGFPEILKDDVYIKLVNATHPLIGESCIPINLEVGNNYDGLVISGPNAGGKTVALKTAGLLTLMALCGLPIPAESHSKIGLFDKVVAEIGDEQSIAENLSSFSGHILNISKILEVCDNKTLVLIDEILSSTSPNEGEALGRAITHEILKKGGKFIITTHYQGIKEIAYSEERVRNAYMEFDEERLIPLYQLHMDGTGSSNALSIARKYGISEEMIREAESYLDSRSSDADKLLKQIEKERNSLAVKKTIVEKQMEETRHYKERYTQLQNELEDEKKKAQKGALQLLKKELDDALKEIASLKMELKRKNYEKPSDFKPIEKTIEHTKSVMEKTESEILERERQKPKEIKLGMTVYVQSYQKEGYVESIIEDRVKVKIGIFSVIVDQNDLYNAKEESSQKPYSFKISGYVESAPYNIDIRGYLGDDALRVVEKSVESAIVSGSPVLNIVHGKGEGILRRLVWDYLKTVKEVKSFQYAKPEDGGQGKTIVYLM